MRLRPRSPAARETRRVAFAHLFSDASATAGVLLFLLLYVVPIYAKVYQQFGADLPGITEWIVACSAGLHTLLADGVQSALVSLMVGLLGWRAYKRQFGLASLSSRDLVRAHWILNVGVVVVVVGILVALCHPIYTLGTVIR